MNTKNLLVKSLILVGLLVPIFYLNNHLKPSSLSSSKDYENLTTAPTPTILPIPTPTPTPKPLTFTQMNELYGPCIRVPTLMYHHVQSQQQAAESGNTSLTVFTAIFRTQMEYLKQQGYVPVSLLEISSFLNQGSSLPAKPILLTFDDGYQDFYSDAWPVLKEFSFKATIFLPTGLMNNSGYLNWNQINEIASSGNIDFANHTWSHHNAADTYETVEKEITLADTQLTERGLNNLKAFSYPYGFSTQTAQQILSGLNYQLAFTTQPGSTLCSKQRLALPRIRIGNTHLANYGF